ncbi:MAG: YdeI/OmpD-associated family protein [Ignavibacteriaceae bacterium]
MVHKSSKIKATEELKVIAFKSPEDCNKWLSENHSASKGIWIRLFKKDSGVKSLTRDEILDEALCYGWIDGQAKKYDEKSWIQKFTPRRPKSIWSKRNIERVKILIKKRKMQPAGLKAIDDAKKDGRWEKAYDSPANMKVPDDFLNELRNKKLLKFFESLNRTNKYSIIWRLQTAKKTETRIRRMKKILDMLSKGEKFH